MDKTTSFTLNSFTLLGKFEPCDVLSCSKIVLTIVNIFPRVHHAALLFSLHLWFSMVASFVASTLCCHIAIACHA